MSEQTIEQTRSLADAASEKEGVGARAPQWRYGGLFASPSEAAEFVNRPPAQQRGEASMSVRDDGRTDVFYFL